MCRLARIPSPLWWSSEDRVTLGLAVLIIVVVILLTAFMFKDLGAAPNQIYRVEIQHD